MSRRGATLAVASALALALGLAGTQVEVPYVGLGPGPLYNTLGAAGTRQLISVPADRDHPAKGELNLTTVNVYSELTLVEALRQWFDRDYAVVPYDLIFPKDKSPAETDADNRKAMEESQNDAIKVALCELGTPVLSRVEIEAVSKDSPAAAAGLRVGDFVSEIDGRPVDSVCTLRRLTGAHRPGDVVQVTVLRDRAERTVAVRTNPGETTADGAPLLGVGLLERDEKPPFKIEIAVEDVGGPSAGLMFALGIYDRLTPGDLTGGRVLAGTGTIDGDGFVGAIGGIQQKVVAARAYGAEWFITPTGNYDAALAAKPAGLRLARVSTFKEALAALRDIAAGRTPANSSS